MLNDSPLVSAFINSRGLVRQHISSFNYFISHEIRNIMLANQIVDSDIDPAFYLKYTNIYVTPPSVEESMLSFDITPHECRLRDLNYSSFIYVDVEYVKNKTIVSKKRCCIGKIPVMLRSDICHLARSTKNLMECPLDVGGYFIVKGVERVILVQEQTSKNRMMLENGSCAVTSSTHERKSKTLVIKKKGILYLKSNSFTEDLPVVIAIKSLGVITDKEIIQYVGEELEEEFAASLEECAKNGIFSEEHALVYIGNIIKARMDVPKHEEARTIMTEVILPNVYCEGVNYRAKAIYIALMARKVLLPHDDVQSDKDFVGNKRFELAGQLLSIMFEDLFKKYNTELKKSIDKVLSKQSRAQEFDAVTFLNLQVNIITMAFIRAISTGNWVVKRFRMEKKGVTQVLSRLSYISALGMMGRINSQFEKTRKVSGPRSLHTSQWGMLCPADTPEGESCGLVKNLALMSEITTDTDYEHLKSLLFKLGVVSIHLPTNIHRNNYIVFLDGMICGTINNPILFIFNFKTLRRAGKINKFVSISRNEVQKIINVSGDGGRIVRPLIIINDKERINEDTMHSKNIMQKDEYVDDAFLYSGTNEKAQKKINFYLHDRVSITNDDIKFIKEKYKLFEDLVEEGKIEFLDSNELGDSLVALYPADIIDCTTHLEIDPFTILGTVSGLIPYPHHNQSPRNTYQCAMGKQAMGFIGYNQYKRIDTLLYILTYSQRPIVQSKTIELINFVKLPAGINAMVAVMSFSGYDIEDALVINKDSIDRGFGRCEVYKGFSTSLKRYSDGTYDRIVGKKRTDIDLEKMSLNTDKAKNELADKNIQQICKDNTLSNENNNSIDETENKKNNPSDDKTFTSLNISTGKTIKDEKLKNNNEDSNAIKSTEEYMTQDLNNAPKEKPKQVTVSKINTVEKVSSFLENRERILENDGLAAPGQRIFDGQVYVNMQSPTGNSGEYKFSGLVYRGKQPSYIDKVIMTKSGEDNLMIKTLIRQTRIPEIGDKFSSRHGQKGVVGLIVPSADMPFSESGLIPDIIMNPHGFPSRMTVGKIIELISGKAALLTGEYRDSTAFCDAKTDEIQEILIANGYSYSGKDIFYCGTTGRLMTGYVFFGPVYYQKLKHMVADKIHARGRGPRAMLTRQPTEGRSRDGGLRLGEMERDCLIGYGASSLLIERLLISSDAFDCSVCKQCGVIGIKKCKICGSDDIVNVRMPYACKLLFQELMSMNILPKLIVE